MFEPDTCASCGQHTPEKAISTSHTVVSLQFFDWKIELKKDVEKYCFDCRDDVVGDQL